MSSRPISTLMLFGFCGILSAADYYISPAGIDGNPGTIAQPWKTFAHAVPLLSAGDTLHLRGGQPFAERLVLTGKSGTAQLPIVIRNFEGETAVIDGVTLTVPAGDRAGLVVLENCNHVCLSGIQVKDFRTDDAEKVPVGIQIEGSGTGLKILGCKVHGIWQSNSTIRDEDDYAIANGFGIAVYGTEPTPIEGLILDGNEVTNLRTGRSESVVLNGNVTGFSVTRNHIHACNNIGIDFIGHEGSAPANVDFARNGVVRENLVHGINSAFNPGYKGDFVTGGGEQSAPGLYVDGGSDILMERNVAYDCGFGVSVGSENAGKVSANVIVRNNLIHHCHEGGIVIGGSTTQNGGASGCSFTNNTLYFNDTTEAGGGQIMIQRGVTGTVIQHNLMASPAEFVQFVLKSNNSGSFAPGAIDWNLYHLSPGASFEFIWNGSPKVTFATWRSAASLSKDANSTMITTSPGLVNAAPGTGSPASDFALVATSPAKDAGNPSFVPASGEKDAAGRSRVANGRVDLGAHEFMTALQAWRDLHFSLPDGTGIAADDADPESDGTRNLVEYSQGMNPLVSDPQLGPAGLRQGNFFRFQYRKAAPELGYQVQTSTDFSTWPATGVVEQSDGNGLFWRDFPIGTNSRFFRLSVGP